MIDRFLLNFFGSIDKIFEWIANKISGPRCKCKKNVKKD